MSAAPDEQRSHRPTRAEVLAAAVEHLEWLNTIPHTLEDCLRVQANETERDRDGDRPLVDPGRDPSSAPSAGPPMSTDDPEAAPVDATLDRLHGDCAELDGIVSDAMGRTRRRPPAPHGRQGKVAQAVAAIHSAAGDVESVYEWCDHAWAERIETLAHGIGDDAAWLHAKATGIYDSARLTSRIRVETKPLAGCKSCARDTDTPTGEPYFEMVAVGQYATYCRWCGDYTGAEKVEPPLGAVRWMHRHGKRPTSKVIADALKADGPGPSVTRRRRRSPVGA